MKSDFLRFVAAVALLAAVPVSVFARDVALETAKVAPDAPGVCLVLDCGSGERAVAIARETGMFVFAIAK
ncbi:MAG TPA: hypothetical protein VMX57_01285, partial [Planctomycetota bacterium]|nr:hypothetical protein [Planctomycetota bacterium]